MLKITNLIVSISGKTIINGLDFTINPGEIHAIMGPNGAGKSTLARVLAGDPAYEVESGSIEFLGKNILELEIEERAHLGIFMGFQYPTEINGVSNQDFLYSALNSLRKSQNLEPLERQAFMELLENKMKDVGVGHQFLERDVNGGFSGGEKKKNEILQMAILRPQLAILDETDSGLDIDAMKIVSSGVKSLITKTNALILITHYQRLLDYIKPDFVHIFVDGKIIKTGDQTLAVQLEAQGYQTL